MALFNGCGQNLLVTKVSCVKSSWEVETASFCGSVTKGLLSDYQKPLRLADGVHRRLQAPYLGSKDNLVAQPRRRTHPYQGE